MAGPLKSSVLVCLCNVQANFPELSFQSEPQMGWVWFITIM
ncbi:hypothetical protein CEXT_815561, partial [Caerostris extrusa]